MKSGNLPRKRQYNTPFGQNSSLMNVDRHKVGTRTTNELEFTLWWNSNQSTLKEYFVLVLIYWGISAGKNNLQGFIETWVLVAPTTGESSR